MNKSDNRGRALGTDPGDRSEGSLNLSSELQQIRREVDQDRAVRENSDGEGHRAPQLAGPAAALEESGHGLDRLTDLSNLDSQSQVSQSFQSNAST